MAETQLAVGLKKQDAGDLGWSSGLNSGFDDANTRLTRTFAGNPNGNVQGDWIGQRCYDTANDVLYYCHTTGDASTAVWRAEKLVFAGDPNGSVAGHVGKRVWDSTNYSWWTCIVEGDALGAQWIADIPGGTVVEYEGSVAAIPSGWLLCDGTGGTPDHGAVFTVGYKSSETDYDTVGKTGGEKEVTLTEAQMPAHTHDRTLGVNNLGVATAQPYYGGNTGIVNANPTGSTGGDQAHENRPPYRVVGKIIKLPLP